MRATRIVDPSAFTELKRARAQRRRFTLRAVTSSYLGGWTDQHLACGWQLPHRVYVVHLLDEHQFKVGVTRADNDRRLKDLGCGRTALLVDAVETPDRLVAELVEVETLSLVEPWHQFGERHRIGRGYTERWSDDGPSIDLTGLLAVVDRCIAEALQN